MYDYLFLCRRMILGSSECRGGWWSPPVMVTPVVSTAMVWPAMVSPMVMPAMLTAMVMLAMLTAMVTPLDGPRTDGRSPPLHSGSPLVYFFLLVNWFPIFSQFSLLSNSFQFDNAGVSQPGSSRLPELSQDNHNLVVPTDLSYRIEQRNSRRLILTPALNITRATNWVLSPVSLNLHLLTCFCF